MPTTLHITNKSETADQICQKKNCSNHTPAVYYYRTSRSFDSHEWINVPSTNAMPCDEMNPEIL